MAAEDVLPLRPAILAVLAGLSAGPVAGFTILERVNEATPRSAILGPGTLYRLLREMRRDGLIERTAPPAGEEGGEDERRTYHALTTWGRSVLRAEAVRLERSLRAAGLLGGEEAGR
jgi:DNA-binding PadR family transcriptional regulator